MIRGQMFRQKRCSLVCGGIAGAAQNARMTTHEVRFRAMAEADLRELYDYIADHGGASIAGAYVDRTEMACLALASFPRRGVRRNDL